MAFHDKGLEEEQEEEGKGLEIRTGCSSSLRNCLRAEDVLQPLCSSTIGPGPLPDRCESGGDGHLVEERPGGRALWERAAGLLEVTGFPLSTTMIF